MVFYIGILLMLLGHIISFFVSIDKIELVIRIVNIIGLILAAISMCKLEKDKTKLKRRSILLVILALALALTAMINNYIHYGEYFGLEYAFTTSFIPSLINSYSIVWFIYLLSKNKKEKEEVKEVKKADIKNLKKKNPIVWYITLVVGLIPITLLLLVSISSMSEGFSLIDPSSAVYGKDAFLATFQLVGIIFSPIILLGAALSLLSVFKIDKIRTINKKIDSTSSHKKR